MDRTALQDKRISWKAKGIMAHLLSMPDDWVFYMNELLKYSTDGEASFRAGFKELTKFGYVKRYPIREGSRIVRWETVVFENPLLSDFQQVENQDVENLDIESLDVENQVLLSTDLELSTDSLLSTDKTNSFRDLFDHYISKDIIKHSKITSGMKTAANARLKDYTFEQLIQVIDNYAAIYKSEKYWFSTKYGFADLMRDKDVRKFIDDADPFNNFAVGFMKRGGNNEADRTSPSRIDERQSKINATNERRKRIAGIQSN